MSCSGSAALVERSAPPIATSLHNACAAKADMLLGGAAAMDKNAEHGTYLRHRMGRMATSALECIVVSTQAGGLCGPCSGGTGISALAFKNDGDTMSKL